MLREAIKRLDRQTEAADMRFIMVLDEHPSREKLVTDRSLLVVIYIMRGKRIRIISARKPERHEHERYYRQGS